MEPLLAGFFMDEYKSVDELIEILIGRGLSIDDRVSATQYLTTVGHHRLSAFYPAFYEDTSQFDQSIPTTLDEVIRLYSFDRRLRLHLSGPLEKVEVSLRAMIVKEMGDYNKLNTESENFNLFDEQFFDLSTPAKVAKFKNIQGRCFQQAYSPWHTKHWLRQKRLIERGYFEEHGHNIDRRALSEKAREMFRESYFHRPAWGKLQVVSFGILANLYYLLKEEIQVPIAREFGLPSKILPTIFYALKELRNACAHHEPVWNWDARYSRAPFPFPKRYAAMATITNENRGRIYAYCAVIHIILKNLSFGASTWYRRLKKLMNEYNTAYGDALGFPREWQSAPFWCVSDVGRVDGQDALRRRLSSYI